MYTPYGTRTRTRIHPTFSIHGSKSKVRAEDRSDVVLMGESTGTSRVGCLAFVSERFPYSVTSIDYRLYSCQ